MENVLCNLEAEQAVLGSILIDPECIHEVAGILSTNDFYRRAHQVIFDTMASIKEAGEPLDLVTLTATLQENGTLKEIGDVPYLNQLASSVPTVVNVAYYAKLVREKSTLRRLNQVGAKISHLCQNNNDIQDVLNQAEEAIIEVSDQALTGHHDTIKSLEDLFRSASERLEKRMQNPGKIQGLESGFVDLDRKLSGFKKQDLIILAARPSMGKTALALNIAANVAVRKNKSVAFFNLEMSDEQIADRLICSEGNIDSQAFGLGMLNDQDLEKFAGVSATIAGKKLFIDDKPNMTISEIKAKCRKIARNHALDLVVIDYLQLIQSEKDAFSRNEEVSRISRALKIMARELDIPVLVLSQLSRSVEQRNNKRPMLSDLRDSGSIEQDADVVLFLYRDGYYNPDSERPNITELIIGKQRNGPTGTIEMLFLKNYSKFLSLEVKAGKEKVCR